MKNRNERLKLEDEFSELLDGTFIVDACLFEIAEMFSNLSSLRFCWRKEIETVYRWLILKFDIPRFSFSCSPVSM